MKERIFNLFLLITDGIISELGAFFHDISGTDEEKLTFLKAQVENDLRSAKLFNVPKKYIYIDGNNKGTHGQISYQSYKKLGDIGRDLEIFEDVFNKLHASRNPLVCITPIVNGKPMIDACVDITNISELK